MDLLNDNPNKLFLKFLIPAVSSAIAVAAYSFVDISGKYAILASDNDFSPENYKKAIRRLAIHFYKPKIIKEF